MSLLAPALLLGLLGLSLPLVAHLLGREPPKKIPFGAIRFLDAGDPVVTQRRRLHDRLLLLVRLALLATLVLLLARPVSFAPRALTVLSEPHDAVILVDASMSMDLVVDGTSDLQRASDVVETILDALPAGSRIGLITSDPRGPHLAPSADKNEIARELAQWIQQGPPRRGGWVLGEAVQAAASLLGPARGRSQVIYAVGDRTTRGLASLPASAASDIAIVPLPTRQPTGTPSSLAVAEHVGIVKLEWEPAPEVDPRAVHIRATLRRFGADADADVLSVRLKLQVEHDATPAEVDLEPGGTAKAEFTHTLLDGGAATKARVEIVGRDDALPGDDVRHLWISNQDQLAVTIVNGDPSQLRAHDEVFFLATALRAAAAPDRLKLSSLAPEQLERSLREGGLKALVDTDLLILANARAPQADVAPIIVDRVRDGMGLWVTVGDRVEATPYNQRLGDVLPLLLRGPVFAGTAPGRTQARTEGFAPTQLSHPIFAGRSGELGLRQTQTRRLFLLEPDAKRATRAALLFTNGAPALLTARVGEGRVGLLATSIDRDWTDLPLRPGFVPLMQRTIAFLGGLSDATSGSAIHVGETKEFRSKTALYIQDPAAVETRSGPDTDGWVRFENTQIPGHYQVRRERAGIGRAHRNEVFAVQTNPLESDLAQVEIPVAQLSEDQVDAVVPVPQGRWLLWLIAGLLGAEVVLRWRASMAR
ncbi:MAG: VWA domain-containing protein [Nannocystaceae bacterium]